MSLKRLCRNLKQAMILLNVFTMLSCVGNQTAWNDAQFAAAESPHTLSKEAVFNSSCFIFNLGDGPNYSIRLRQGKFKNGNEEGFLSDKFFAQGKLDSEPANVALLIWSTGGSGCFEELALFRLRTGKACCTGIYSLEDRAVINKLSIQNNEVLLDWVKHADGDAAPSPSKHEVLHLKISQFEKCGS